MKLGESGEAFFVEEIQDSDIEEIPEHLATSPIPVSQFEELYNAQVFICYFIFYRSLFNEMFCFVEPPKKQFQSGRNETGVGESSERLHKA